MHLKRAYVIINTHNCKKIIIHRFFLFQKTLGTYQLVKQNLIQTNLDFDSVKEKKKNVRGKSLIQVFASLILTITKHK